MENSAYMESVAGHRAVLAYSQDEEGAPRQRAAHLRRDRLGPAAGTRHFHLHQREFRRVPHYLRNLSLRDQELLLAYYCLRKTQTQLAPIFKTSQTLCSAGMRAAVRAMCAYIAFGGQPTEERMRSILQAMGAEEAFLSTRPKMQY